MINPIGGKDIILTGTSIYNGLHIAEKKGFELWELSQKVKKNKNNSHLYLYGLYTPWCVVSILIHLPPLYSVSTIHSFYNFEPNSLSFNLLCYSTALHRNTGLPSKDKTSDDPVRNFGLFLALIFRSLFQLIKKHH